MVRFAKIFGNLVILILTVWCIIVTIAYMKGISVYFPWREVIPGEIPINRLEAIRLAVILTFAYFGILHIFGKNVRQYPINFLTVFLFYLVISGTFVAYKYDIIKHEIWVIVVWATFWLSSYIASKKEIRNYFKRRR